jgi:uncharacterized protein (DUF362 family)
MTLNANRFTVDGLPAVAITRASTDLKQSLVDTVGFIGGLERLSLRGETVLLKPNYNTADPPPASSDPFFVRAAIELLYDYGAAKVIVGESSMFAISTRQVLAKTGLLAAARQAGAEVLVFDRWETRRVDGRYLKDVSFAKAALDASRIVYSACLKTHRLGQFTGSLKLAVGFMRPRERLLLHARNLVGKIAELNTLVRPDLVLLDGRTAFITGGPAAGERREPGLILASGDRVAVDVEAVRLIQGFPGNSLAGKDPWQLGQIRRAVELGLGARQSADYVVRTGDARAVGAAT